MAASSNDDNQQQEQQLQRLLSYNPHAPNEVVTNTGNNTAVPSRSVDSSPVVSSSNGGPLSLSRTNTSEEDNLPNNICEAAQLALLPDVCLSGNKKRPLRHVNEQGLVSTYSLNPMTYSVIFILLVELLERFSFYGINYTQTAFLTGQYNEDWNAGFNAIKASSYVSISTAVAYSMPFLGAFLADNVLGDYWSILVGDVFFYIPGLLLITLSTVPGLLGDEFPKKLLSIGLLFLWPMGTGIVKSIVNVFGAKQFHPLLQSSLIESYYVNFYMCINIGALVGGVVVPLVAQYDVTLAYTYPLACLCIGILLFLLGTPRYVRHPPAGDMLSGLSRKKRRNKKHVVSSPVPDAPTIPLFTIFRISSLIIPFNIAYSQMATTFIVQGTVMKKGFGFIDASTMNNADAISVLFFGHVVGSYFYPYLARRNIKIPTTYKFAIGSILGAAAIAWALFVEYLIHSTYNSTGGQVSIMWQAMAYILIGCGEIFAVSAAYEVAFTASSPETKAIASALNLFCVGGLPNVFCIMLYNACQGWFRTSRGTTSIHYIEDYATAQVYKYFLVLFGIALLGIVINFLPSIKAFVASIEETATEMVKTPVMKKRPKRFVKQTSTGTESSYSPSSSTMSPARGDEESPLLRAKRHQAYLKYGSGPVLYKSGSMRAGPSMSHENNEDKQKKKMRVLKKSQVGKLYRTKNDSAALTPAVNVVMTPDGRPMKVGKIAAGKRGHHRQGSM